MPNVPPSSCHAIHPLPLVNLHWAGTAFCRSTPDAARRGAFSVEKSVSSCWRLKSALPRVQPHYSTFGCWAPHARHLDQASPWLVVPQRQIRYAGSLKASSLAHHRRFQHRPRSPGSSRISTIGGHTVTAAKGDYNRCKDQRSANPCLIEGKGQRTP